jgi:vancomycin resistance protein YoaR
MKKLQQQKGGGWVAIGGFFGLGLLTGLVILVGVARLTWHGKFYPGLKIAKQNVGGLTREEASAKLVELTTSYQPKLGFNGYSWTAPKGAALYEMDSSLNRVYRYGRRLNAGDYLLLLVNHNTNFPLILAEGKTEKMEGLINEIAGVVEIPPVDPIILVEGNKVKVVNGTDGTVLDTDKLNKAIAGAYANLSDEGINIPTTTDKRQLSESALSTLQQRAEKLVSKTLVMTLDDERITLGQDELVSMLATNGVDRVKTPSLVEYSNGLAQSLNKNPNDARFEFVGGKVKEFAPGKDGLEVSIQQTANSLQQGIEKLLESEDTSTTVEIKAVRTPPQVTTDKVNDLGIRERIGRGESYYAHSIPNRIYNVDLASTRLNSALMAPGEEVSFNKLVGEVSAATGYRAAYIISGGRTVLGDGGGLCQVSTTMFRAAMSAGLPILERWGHAYRVSYYELNSKPGVDATVIAPSKDFRFKNDTPGHILIQTINDPKKLFLVIEIYGTSDGRVATISEPKVWGVSPPLPTIYQDDPTLPTRTLKQVDWSAPGAKASFEYKVMRNGEMLQEKTFATSYRPWAAVYLRGTGN